MMGHESMGWLGCSILRFRTADVCESAAQTKTKETEAYAENLRRRSAGRAWDVARACAAETLRLACDEA